ncbi:class III poly(R)-hydroxyalkanoic acid synthase subunit PhaC [Natroniella sp. ANB-PHB2]|uniref:class III poly(R)-hydroxyalkanoic acid synthase subunit PhaC n=1 Tax=Natroniella sp. ANB-PHB2 TaxID=3384444 RepID=UPI0038D4CB44
MNLNFGFDIEKSIEEVFDMQKKLVRTMGYMLEMSDVKETEVDATPKDLVYTEDKMKLYHYKPVIKNPCSTPVLIVYALVNKQYVVDIQQDRSMVKKMLEMGLDVYIIDWGYPTQEDKYLTMDDYIDRYINNSVNYILEENGIDEINLLGICQGGTFSTIYSTLYPEKIKNLITMVTPIDFSTNDALLFRWGKHLNIDKMVDAYGILPGNMMNVSFNMLKPFQLTVDKYVGVLEHIDSKEKMKNFMHMEKWIYDSPDQAGETLRQFVKDLYQDNKLIKGELEINGKIVNLDNLDMPLLNVYAEYDHLVPPAASKPLNDLVASEDTTTYSFPVGHIGMFVSSKSQKEITPKITDWILEHSE